MDLRPARESTHPITKSGHRSWWRLNERAWKCVEIAAHLVPQNRLIRLIRTVALFWPMSEAENGCRTQLVSATKSPSMSVTSSPQRWPHARSACSIRPPENNGAAGSAGADHQNPHG